MNSDHMNYQSEYILKNPTLHIENAQINYRGLMLEMSQLNESPSSLLDVGSGVGGFLIVTIKH